jgi:hypothetical protein
MAKISAEFLYMYVTYEHNSQLCVEGGDCWSLDQFLGALYVTRAIYE